jgi:hypothetical protein
VSARGAGPFLASGVLLAAASPSAAQHGWHVYTHAGRLVLEAGPREAGFGSLSLALRREYDGGGFRLAGAVPMEASDPLYLAADGWHRLSWTSGRLQVGLDLGGRGFLYRERRDRSAPGLLDPPLADAPGGAGFTADAFPMIGLRARTLAAELRAGGIHHVAELAGVRQTRTLTGGDVKLSWTPSSRVGLVAEARRLSADEGTYAFAGLTALVALGPASVWATAGRWSADSVAMPVGAGIAWRASRRLTVSLSARRHTLDPVYLAPPRISWGVGATIRLGGIREPVEPVPAEYRDGRATIALPVDDAPDTPRIAGDFTGWKPEPMTRAGTRWIYRVALAPGVYRYAFVDARGRWFVPESVPGRRDDGMGGWQAVLVVR